MRPTLLFAHGAGAPSTSPWMVAWADRLGALGRVHPFDYPYARAGRRAPDRLPKLIDAHRAELRAQRDAGAGRVVLIGKSMGGRVGCHLALDEPVEAVVCLGYPLRTPKGAVRDEVLLALRTPVLFVQGTRDRLCPLDLLDDVRGRMVAPHAVHVVDGGDHSLELTRRRQAEQASSDAAVLAAIRAFLAP
jgi:predicted alpha/beta-hydrolase family hydrolase